MLHWFISLKHYLICFLTEVLRSSEKLRYISINRIGQDRTKLTFKLDFPGNLWLAAFAILGMFISNLDAPFIMKEIALPGCKVWKNHRCDSLHFDSKDMYEDNFTKSWLKVFLIWVDLSTMMEKLFPKMPKLPTTTWVKQTREGKLWGKQTIAIKRSSSWSTYYSSLYSNGYEWSTCFWSNHSASIDHFHSLMDVWEVIGVIGTSCPVLKYDFHW